MDIIEVIAVQRVENETDNTVRGPLRLVKNVFEPSDYEVQSVLRYEDRVIVGIRVELVLV